MHRQPARVGVVLQIQRMRQMVGAGQQWAEPLAVVGQPADRHAAEADPVVGLLATDEAGALAFAAQPVVGKHDLHRAIHRFRAGVGEEHMAQARRGDCGQSLRQHEGQRRAHLEGRREIQRAGLIADGCHDALAAMSCIAAPQACRAVQNLAPLDIAVIHALRRGQQARPCLELAIGGERHPEGIQLRRCLQRIGGIAGKVVGHGRLRRSGSPDCTQLAPGPSPETPADAQQAGASCIPRSSDTRTGPCQHVPQCCAYSRCRERFRDAVGEVRTD